MTYALDTNAVSALMKGNAAMARHLRSVQRRDVVIPQPVIAEIAYGIERLSRSRRRTSLAERFELIRTELGRAEWTDAVSDMFGAIKSALERRGQRIEDFDVAVAAHALAVKAVLVTANAKHMMRVQGLVVEDWARD